VLNTSGRGSDAPGSISSTAATPPPCSKATASESARRVPVVPACRLPPRIVSLRTPDGAAVATARAEEIPVEGFVQLAQTLAAERAQR